MKRIKRAVITAFAAAVLCAAGRAAATDTWIKAVIPPDAPPNGLQIAGAPAITFTDKSFSLIVWMKAAGITAESAGMGLFYLDGWGDNGETCFRILPPDMVPAISITAVGGGTQILVSGTTTINDGEEHCLAATFERNAAHGLKFYIDGEEENSHTTDVVQNLASIDRNITMPGCVVAFLGSIEGFDAQVKIEGTVNFDGIYTILNTDPDSQALIFSCAAGATVQESGTGTATSVSGDTTPISSDYMDYTYFDLITPQLYPMSAWVDQARFYDDTVLTANQVADIYNLGRGEKVNETEFAAITARGWYTEMDSNGTAIYGRTLDAETWSNFDLTTFGPGGIYGSEAGGVPFSAMIMPALNQYTRRRIQ